MATNGFAPFSANTFWKIKPRELIVDCFLIGITLYISRSLRAYVNTASQESSASLQTIIVGTQFILPWYLGYLYGRYLTYYGGFIRILIQVIAFIIFMMFVGFVINFLTGLPKSSSLSGADNFIFFALFWTFAIIVSPFLALSGKSTGKGCFIKLTEKDKNGSFFLIVLICVGTAIFLFGMFILMYYLGNVLGIVVSIVLLILILYLGYKLYGVLKDTYAIHLIESIATNIFPLLILVSLTVWSFICVQTALTDNLGNHLPFKQILVILTINGFIPLRLIQMFDPPLSILNLLLSIASLVILFSAIN